MPNAIKINNVSHSFNEKAVLRGINLEIKKGEIFGLLGPSGAGKTTLINIVTGQINSSEGGCQISGVASNKLSGEQYKKIGVMMDHFGLYERMTCFDNLKFYEMLDGNSVSRIESVLSQVGLLESKKVQVADLSKGMKNRLSFARAILRSPEILFLDEPTSGLDPNTMKEIHKMILAEKEKGTTIFLTTHNMHEAEKLCDNIALLNEGKIVEYGKPTELCRKYNNQKKYKIHLKSGEDIELSHETDDIEKIVFICMMGSLVIAFAGGYTGKELLTFMLIMFVGHTISMLAGAAIGVFSKNQMMATSLTVPVMMIFSFLPMLSMFNDSIKKIAKFFYSEQLYLLINDLNSIEISMEIIAILGINICLILSCFIVAYQKVFIKQY